MYWKPGKTSFEFALGSLDLKPNDLCHGTGISFFLPISLLGTQYLSDRLDGNFQPLESRFRKRRDPDLFASFVNALQTYYFVF